MNKQRREELEKILDAINDLKDQVESLHGRAGILRQYARLEDPVEQIEEARSA